MLTADSITKRETSGYYYYFQLEVDTTYEEVLLKVMLNLILIKALQIISNLSVQFSSVQSLSHAQLFATPWIAARQASLSITNSWSSPRPTSIESVMPSSHLILCRTLLLLPPIPPSIRVFSKESTLRIRWPEYWSFSFSIIPSKKIPGLISFRMDWLDLLAVQGTLKSLLQYHSSKASMEYYLAIKKSTFESVLMRWMKTEPIIQREVSQKEKHQYSILTHIYGI